MSRPTERPEAGAASIQANTDLLTALAQTLGCHVDDLPPARPYNEAAAEFERDWPTDGPNDWRAGQTAYERFLDQIGEAR